MPELFRIYVGEQEIYSGPLAEIPDYYRANLVDAVSEWGDCLSKGGFRELLYSSLHWYNLKAYSCGDCGRSFDEDGRCPECGGETAETFVHERNPSIDKIMMCIGLVDRVEMEVV